MKILFATDGSEAALAALKSLLDRRALFAAPLELTLLTVHLAIPFKRAAAWAGHEALRKYYDEECEAALGPAIAECTSREVLFTADKKVGEAAPTIVATAEAGGFDLIALGAQGHSALAHLVMGSVAAKVVSASTRVPVLLLR